MSKRAGVLSLVAGVVAAGGLGAVAVNRQIARRRDVDISPFLDPPADRRGRIKADDGRSLYYEEVGSRDAPLTVVMVHGFCLRMGAWYFQRRDLVERFGSDVRFVFYDQRSHGQSEAGDTASASIDQLGRDLAVVIETLAPDGPLVLIGHSMGGMTLMALADAVPKLFNGRRRARIAGVALISTSTGKMATVTLGLPSLLARVQGPVMPLLLRGLRSQAELVERGRAIGSDLAWAITRRLSFGPAPVDPAVLEYLTSMLASTRIDVIAGFYKSLIDHDKLAALKVLIDVPTVIICGDHDVITPLAHSQEMAAELPGATMIVVEGAGHLAPMEFPAPVTAALAELIEQARATALRR